MEWMFKAAVAPPRASRASAQDLRRRNRSRGRYLRHGEALRWVLECILQQHLMRAFAQFLPKIDSHRVIKVVPIVDINLSHREIIHLRVNRSSGGGQFQSRQHRLDTVGDSESSNHFDTASNPRDMDSLPIGASIEGNW
jgi:hypothetical protein